MTYPYSIFAMQLVAFFLVGGCLGFLINVCLGV
jgi:hypothetical protein